MGRVNSHRTKHNRTKRWAFIAYLRRDIIGIITTHMFRALFRMHVHMYLHRRSQLIRLYHSEETRQSAISKTHFTRVLLLREWNYSVNKNKNTRDYEWTRLHNVCLEMAETWAGLIFFDVKTTIIWLRLISIDNYFINYRKYDKKYLILSTPNDCMSANSPERKRSTQRDWRTVGMQHTSACTLVRSSSRGEICSARTPHRDRPRWSAVKPPNTICRPNWWLSGNAYTYLHFLYAQGAAFNKNNTQLTQCSPGTAGKKYALTNHGKPRHSKMSNVFEPIELLMPIAPWPWLVTITLETASGTLVPAARNVSPITESGMLIVSPGNKDYYD